MLNFNHLIQDLQYRLQMPLPADEVRKIMAPELRQIKDFKMPNPDKAKKAGVMLMLYPHNDTIYTTLMKRAEDGYTHGGQISFPGGRHEKTDENLIVTALRETEEEFGVAQHLIQVVGQLSDLYIPASNSLVSPSIGVLQQRPLFNPNPKEVDTIIEVTLPYMLNPNIIKQGQIKANRRIQLQAPYYDVHGHILWGATAMMMSEFLAIVKQIIK